MIRTDYYTSYRRVSFISDGFAYLRVMQKSEVFSLSIGLILIYLCGIASLTSITHGQLHTATTKTGKEHNMVSVNSNLTVLVSNQTIKAKEQNLRSAVLGVLNSATSGLKGSVNDQAIAKTKIINRINNATQSVEGTEATNAVIGIEIGKALRTLVSASKGVQTVSITIGTSSNCKPTPSNIIACENTVNIQ